MAELTVKPWRRAGKDRLYVNLAGPRGQAVAWLDCPTGVVTITDAAHESSALDRIREWCRTCGRAIPPLTVVHKISPPVPPPVPPLVPPRPTSPPVVLPALPPLTTEDDLASNCPGEGVRGMIRADESKRTWLVRMAAKLSGDDLTRSELSKGLDGEKLVGGLLDGLRAYGWYVLHAVPLPSGADIDHVVIGPPGVFTVNTKHHPDAMVWVGDKRITVNRNSYPYIEKSSLEGSRTAELLHRWCGLAVPVHPVIAVVGARTLTQKGSPGVDVVDGTRIAGVLGSRPPILEAHRAAAVFEVARRRSVWAQFGRRTG
ncbi:nuclease-related domain-containing protein [Kitasatospora purpeofusca]|uniref:nuclease-related domain-containing protein n=1 Tax=Kitasatospora purpeofusca TaxID=67352 RepID=UPI002A5A9366|nr:nuclease-related domain-containing protein [Kitasatospora purpeofusca]MDY0814038.1 nuclease-related domain-containing protein [Kitasatospora purpeofusca]